MTYVKTHWINNEEPSIDADNLNKMEQGIYDAQYPDGGSEGQLLARTATGKAWVDAPNSAVWGLIQGTLSDQTDLAIALENTGKVDTVNGIEPDVYKNVQVDVEITKQGWDALPSTKYTDDINYYIKDGTNIPQAGVISASGVTYSNTSSGLDATTVQGAIDENASEIADVKSGLSDGDSTYVKLPDGTMITHTTHTGIKSGDRITYPQQFVGQPHIFFSTNYNTATTIKCIFTASSASNTGFDIYAWDTSTNAVSTSTTLSVNVLAIGRWK